MKTRRQTQKNLKDALVRPVLKIFIVAGEPSGDELGSHLMSALRGLSSVSLSFSGVGGKKMEKEGLNSLFPLEDIAVMGLWPVLQRLSLLLRRLRRVVEEVLRIKPDVLLLIDSPEFTHRIARRVKKHCPNLLIVQYVSPSVWAWRAYRAKRMRLYMDHVLALFPFEPEVYKVLGGPPCTYVGHPLLEERKGESFPLQGPLQGSPGNSNLDTLLLLPGSRLSEIERLMPIFGETLQLMQEGAHLEEYRVGLLTLTSVRQNVEAHVTQWREKWNIEIEVLEGEKSKIEIFSRTKAALAASGTVTLELALANIPMIVAYKVSKLEEQIKYFLHISSIVLPNLILGKNFIPEFVQKACTATHLASALKHVLEEENCRTQQIENMQEMRRLLTLPDQKIPSQYAASILLEIMEKKRLDCFNTFNLLRSREK